MAQRNSSASHSASKPRPTKVATRNEADPNLEFVGQWQRLVSTTNWEKGRIICQWRDALMATGASVSSYSDEAWSQLVGDVSSQHVGRLRRVYQRFGDQAAEYPGLYWSHFQAALEWDDAPMWLEGAVQNDWSISQMRGKRWETLGTPLEEQRAELEEAPEFDFEAREAQLVATDSPAQLAAAPPLREPRSTTIAPSPDFTGDESDTYSFKPPITEKRAPATPRLKVNLSLLPDDLADAYEQFKLAILAQRREGWRDTSRETVVECLDALRELALSQD